MISWPETLPTAEVPVNLMRINRDNAGIYLRSYINNRDHINRTRTPTATAVIKRPNLEIARAAVADLLGDDNLHMGIFDDTDLVGSAVLRPKDPSNGAELGFWVDQEQINKGYASLAVGAIAKYGLTVFPRVYAEIELGNYAGIRVLQKNDFTLNLRQTEQVQPKALEYERLNTHS